MVAEETDVEGFIFTGHVSDGSRLPAALATAGPHHVTVPVGRLSVRGRGDPRAAIRDQEPVRGVAAVGGSKP